MSLCRSLAPATIAAAFLGGCTGDGTAPPLPAAVALQGAGGGVMLFAFGHTYQLRAAVLDRNGDTITGQNLTWSSSNPTVATVSGTGLVLAVANGSTQVRAHAGTLDSDALGVTVSQEVRSLLKVGGDAQTGAPGAQLPAAIAVQAFDEAGSAIAGATVNFVVTQGGGSVSVPSAMTAGDGRAAVTWTLGPTAGTAQQVRASARRQQFAIHPTPPVYPDPAPVMFDATAAVTVQPSLLSPRRRSSSP